MQSARLPSFPLNEFKSPASDCGLLSRVPRCGSGSAAGVSGPQHGHRRSPRLPHPLRGLRRHALLHPEEEIRQCVCAAGKHPRYSLRRQLVGIGLVKCFLKFPHPCMDSMAVGRLVELSENLLQNLPRNLPSQTTFIARMCSTFIVKRSAVLNLSIIVSSRYSTTSFPPYTVG